jgi:hypothetical protein
MGRSEGPVKIAKIAGIATIAKIAKESKLKGGFVFQGKCLNPVEAPLPAVVVP